MIWDEYEATRAGHMAEVEDFHRDYGTSPSRPSTRVASSSSNSACSPAKASSPATAPLSSEVDRDWLLPYGPDWHRKYHLWRRHIQAGLDRQNLHRDTVLDGVKAGSWLHRQFTTWNSLVPGQRRLLAPWRVPLPTAPKPAAGGRKGPTFEENAQLLRQFVQRNGRPPRAREWIDVDGGRVMIGPWLAKTNTKRNAGELPNAQESLLTDILDTPADADVEQQGEAERTCSR